MINYFYGPDTWAARRAIGELVEERGVVLRWLDREELEEQPFTAWLARSTGGMFGEELLVVRDPGAMPKRVQEELVAAGAAKSGAVVLWERGAPDRRTALWRAYREVGREFPAPSEAELVSWVRGIAKDGSVELTLPAARLLVTNLDGDRWRLLAEVERLSLRGGEIDEKVVREEIDGQPEAEVFTLLDQLAGQERVAAVESAERLLDGGASEFYLLSMLAWQYRTLLAVRLGIEAGKNQEGIVAESGLKPFSVRKGYELAKTQPAAYWRGALARILATDFAVKQGKVDARTGVLMLMTVRA